MKGRQVVLDHIDGRPAAALRVDGRLEDLLIDPEGHEAGPGAIFRARADRPMKGQGGMFVTLPDGQGFLRAPKGVSQGQTLLVQVTGHAEPGKAPPLTTKVLFKSRHVILTPGAPGLNVSRSIRDDDLRDALLALLHDGMQGADPSFGAILRSASAQADPDEIADDIAETRALAEAVTADTEGGPELLVEAADAHLVAWREWAQPAPDQILDADGAFEDSGVADDIEDLQGPVASLPGGGSIIVEPTRAMIAVDVNTGADTSLAAGLKANIAAARELPRQLRLRGLGGQITVDFAPMPKKERRQLEQVLRAAFRADSVDTTLAGWTPLGNFELQRKRERLPLFAGRK
ncbi:ribonuclease G [Actibacterium mucosum KCTC 23349]|uniref:Ribonuclease G n=1 Tax=Actibacterium mucosum KCTC 23349 TaxID=1454373 RepID=A0A037ZH52_9RHOB|nr:ribonuclease E/G [Actibacterium mucosum]KAJ55785.1 ribonuclease G [Actibacterium mucosum KCTC 23349]